MTSLKRKSALALAWDFGGLLVSRGSGFIISIVLARLLSPAEFGLVGMAMVFIAISHGFVDVGFTSALVQRKENTDSMYSSVFFFNVASGLLLTLLFFFIAPLIGHFYDNAEVTNIVRWLSLSLLLGSFNQVQSAILSKELNFKALTLRNVIASVIAGIVGVVAAFNGFGVYALVMQSLCDALLSTILLWSVSSWKPRLHFSWKELKSLIGYSSYAFFDKIVSNIFNKLDVLLIGKLFSPATLGFYTRAVSLKDQVIIYSTTSLRSVFFPVLSSLQDKHEEYERVYFKVISLVAFISYALTGILYVMGKHIIVGLFGEKWMPSVVIFQILVLSVCNFPMNSMIINAFMSKGFAKENFKVGLLRKGVGIIPLFVAYFYGIYEFTVALVISDYLLTIVNMLFLKHYVHLSIKKHLRKIFEGMVPLVLCIVVFHLFELYDFWQSLALAVVFLIIYLMFNYIVKAEGITYIQSHFLDATDKWKRKWHR